MQAEHNLLMNVSGNNAVKKKARKIVITRYAQTSLTGYWMQFLLCVFFLN